MFGSTQTSSARFATSLAGHGFHSIFTAGNPLPAPKHMLSLALPELANAASCAPFQSLHVSDCTKSCHLPVDCLHLIENKPDKLAIFSLTRDLKGVQQDRSLTVS
jgi:hypothetical protein